MKIVNIENKNIVIKGLGKLFYQDGIPLSISIHHLKSKNIEVSTLHIADELLKNGWKEKTVVNKITEELKGYITNKQLEDIKTFCNSSYEEQREMIFNSLFKNKQQAIEFIKQ